MNKRKETILLVSVSGAIILAAIFFIYLFFHSFLGLDPMPFIDTEKFYENETYLLIGRHLIDKETGEIKELAHDTEATIEDLDSIDPPGEYTYQFHLNDNTIEEHTYIESSHRYPYSSKYFYQLHPCIISYNYDGEETDRCYTGAPITRDEFSFWFNDAFPIYSEITFDESDYNTDIQKAILGLANKYPSDTVAGIAKPHGDHYRFSIAIAAKKQFGSGAGLQHSIRNSQIISCDPDTGAFEEIYTHKKKGAIIIDFDENGYYTFDTHQRIYYHDFKTKNSKKIITLEGDITHIDITDQYFGIIKDHQQMTYKYLVCDKEGNILTDALVDDQKAYSPNNS